MKKLEGKVVLVTGAARGIGAANGGAIAGIGTLSDIADVVAFFGFI
jgi:hypothetical protein